MHFVNLIWPVRLCCICLVLSHFPGRAAAQTAVSKTSASQTSLEKRADLNLQAAKGNPLALRHFLLGMPKGADLHNHLGGAVYAESWIRGAVADHLCIDLQEHSFTQPQSAAPSDSVQPACKAGEAPASDALKDQRLYDALVDAFSMRGFVPSPGITGHDHFFSTFSKFQEASFQHMGEWIDEVSSRAAAQNEQYLELMHTPSFPNTAAHAREIGWQDDLAAMREQLRKLGFKEDIASAKAELDQADTVRREHQRCGRENATDACSVGVRYLCQVLRGFPKAVVFAQTLFCFELIGSDSRYVGINFVMPEDGYTSMTDYALQMQMVGFLHKVYPSTHISLHAGELAPGFVPYEGLCCHIRLAVEEAHAERIGHGVDIMYEDRPHELLKEMAAKHVMVEINLTSNDVILGISGKDHPLPIYRQFRVPVALSTDDEGVSRIDLTHEYVSAVETYGFTYSDLKQMVRTGMAHTFLPGTDLWAKPDNFAQTSGPCSKDVLGAEKPSAHCSDFLQSNEKARAQWELERRFRAFETSR
jgi:adenosine deaminase